MGRTQRWSHHWWRVRWRTRRGVALNDVLRGVRLSLCRENAGATRWKCGAGDGKPAEAGLDVVEWAFEEDFSAIEDTDVVGDSARSPRVSDGWRVRFAPRSAVQSSTSRRRSSSSAMGSRPVVGSSRMSRRERWAMAMASADFVLLPSESFINAVSRGSSRRLTTLRASSSELSYRIEVAV